MNKWNRVELKRYWIDTHRTSNHDIKAVCSRSRSVWYNLYFAVYQKYAIKRALGCLDQPLTGKEVLDIGCGRGRWLQFYSALGTNVVGIDISRDAVGSCRRKGHPAVTGSIENIPFPNNAFDIVNSITVLHHLPHEAQKNAVGEMQRVMKDGGYAVLLESTWEDDPSPHVWGRSIEDWSALFHDCKLMFSETHYYIYLLRALWKFPLLNRVKFIVRTLENVIIAASYPLEFVLLKANHKKNNKGGCST